MQPTTHLIDRAAIPNGDGLYTSRVIDTDEFIDIAREAHTAG